MQGTCTIKLQRCYSKSSHLTHRPDSPHFTVCHGEYMDIQILLQFIIICLFFDFTFSWKASLYFVRRLFAVHDPYFGTTVLLTVYIFIMLTDHFHSRYISTYQNNVRVFVTGYEISLVVFTQGINFTLTSVSHRSRVKIHERDPYAISWAKCPQVPPPRCECDLKRVDLGSFVIQFT